MELIKVFYLINEAKVANMSQPGVRIGGGLHALIHIFFLHGGSKSAKPFWDLNVSCRKLHKKKKNPSSSFTPQKGFEPPTSAWYSTRKPLQHYGL